MRKPATLKPKIWGSSATLHFWETAPGSRAPKGTENNGDGGEDADLEQITHGRWIGANDNFTRFTPSLLGAAPFERSEAAIRNRYR